MTPSTPSKNRPDCGQDCIVLVSGHPGLGGNDFATEVSVVRNPAATAQLDLYEYTAIELASLKALLDRHHPAVLHVSAHCDLAGVWFADDGHPCAIGLDQVQESLAEADHRPSLTVFNICESAYSVRRTASSRSSVISWRGPLDDRNAVRFSRAFYRRLFAGYDVGDSLDYADLMLRVHTSDLRPIVVGPPDVKIQRITL